MSLLEQTIHPVASPLTSSSLLVYKKMVNKKMLLGIDFTKKTTIANCSVPMLKGPSDEAGPSHW